MFFGLEKNTLPFSTLAAAIKSDKLYQMKLAKKDHFQVVLPGIYLSQKPS